MILPENQGRTRVEFDSSAGLPVGVFRLEMKLCKQMA